MNSPVTNLLHSVPTRTLVEELQQRIEVESFRVNPYDPCSIVFGPLEKREDTVPAIILVVTD